MPVTGLFVLAGLAGLLGLFILSLRNRRAGTASHDADFDAGISIVYQYVEIEGKPGRPADDDLEAGLKLLRGVVRQNPQNWAAWWLLGIGYRAQNDAERSIEALRTAASLNPEHSGIARDYSVARDTPVPR